MPVRAAARAAFFAFAVVLVVVACGGPEEPPPPQTYMAFTDDSVGPVCTHLNVPYSGRDCPDTMLYSFFRPADVTAETLVVVTAGGTMRIPIHPKSDAIFLSQSALSTFLLRHYDATDTAAAAALRTYMNGRYRRRP